jgi:hypothetical protein
MAAVPTESEPAERRLVELFWGAALSLSLLSGTTPRTLLEQMFCLAPSDERWRDVDRHDARAMLEQFLAERGAERTGIGETPPVRPGLE